MLMSYIDAAHAILREAGKPLHYRDITRLAIEKQMISPAGKTPTATLNAIVSVDIKRKGTRSQFVRVGRGIFGLRGESSSSSPTASLEAEGVDRRVRIPLFPPYSEVRLILPIWDGQRWGQIRKLRSSIENLWGNPQNPLDWSDPDTWIPERLEGEVRALASAIWEGSGKKVNPRHMYGHWLLASSYALLQRRADDVLELTDLGRDFVTNDQGEAVALVDEGEGLLKLLTIVAEKGPGRRGDFLAEWGDYLKRRSNFGTDSTVKDTLSRRLQNLVERELLLRQGMTYSITDAGLSYLKRNGGDEESDASSEQQQIWDLVKKHLAGIRERLQELLDSMDPIALEHLVKQLLEAMDYQNVTVTAPSGDKGVDVIAEIELGITSVREVVQVKRHRGRIQRKDLDALRGSLHRFGAVRGTIITTNDFARGTTEAAFERGAAPITLINGEKLIDLLIRHDIGVRKKSIELLELDSDAFIAGEAREESGE